MRDSRIISIGYNGTPTGHDNCCEDENGLTKPDVIHAEHNAIEKLRLAGETGKNSICFVTCCPCLSCAKILIDFDIRHVVYDNPKNKQSGLAYLREHGVCVEQLTVQLQ